MTQTPQAIQHFLTEHIIGHFKPAWICMQHGKVLKHDGDFSMYGVNKVHQGDEVESLFPALMGMLTHLDTPLSLMYMELFDGIYAHVHLFHEEDHDWLVMFDVTELGEKEQRVQQVANEQTLRGAKQAKIMDRYLGRAIADRLSLGMANLHAEGERRHIATLFADVRGFTVFNESHDPTIVMATINEYLNTILKPILDEKGVIDKITGDGAMAVFGIIPNSQTGEIHAMRAAREIQKSVAELNKERCHLGLEQLGVGVGIACGEAVLGILGNRDRRTFSAIGRHVNLAARLESQAKAGDIVLDQPTFQALGEPEDLIETRIQQLKGIEGETLLHVFRPFEPFTDTH